MFHQFLKPVLALRQINQRIVAEGLYEFYRILESAKRPQGNIAFNFVMAGLLSCMVKVPSKI